MKIKGQYFVSDRLKYALEVMVEENYARPHDDFLCEYERMNEARCSIQ
jgi:hypothetical protein